jgi:dTDP-4-dehydrorhamnose reductase
VVADQFTCVTYAPHLAEMLLRLIPDDLPKILHLTSAGSNSWYGWARELALAAGFDPARIVPVPTDSGSPVRRPRFSVLGSRYEKINTLIGQYPATKGIADYVLLLKGRM